jgi:hypothetical protein
LVRLQSADCGHTRAFLRLQVLQRKPHPHHFQEFPMKRFHPASKNRSIHAALFAPTVLGTLLLAATSIQAQTKASENDPKSAVPTVTYRSVFKETSLGIEQERVDWRKANNDVGRFERGHVDILKAEEMEEKKMSPQKPPMTPTSPAMPPKAAPAHKH